MYFADEIAISELFCSLKYVLYRIPKLRFRSCIFITVDTSSRFLQAELNVSLANIGQLRSQQETEMKEVEHYVEHIRSLSDEREALTLEFEAENEQLKGQVESLRTEVEGESLND